MVKRIFSFAILLLLATCLVACLDPVGSRWKEMDARREKAARLLRKAQDEMDAKSWTSAVDILERVEELGEKTASVYGMLGKANLEGDRVEAAADAFEKGVAVAPDRVDLQQGLARALLQRGSIDGASKAIETCILLDPESRDSHLLRSQILEQQMDLDRAVEAAKRALALDPDHEASKIRVKELERRRSDDKPHWELAQRHAVKNMLGEAIVALRKAISLDPKTSYRIKLVEWLEASKRYGEAAEVLDGLVVEGVLGESFQKLGQRLKKAGCVIPHAHVLARGAEDSLVKALGFKRRPWTFGKKTKLSWRPVSPPVDYLVRTKHFFRAGTAVVAFSLETRALVRHALQLRRDLLEDRVTIRGCASTVSLVSMKNNYLARWKSDKHKDEIFVEFGEIKKQFGMKRGSEVLFYLSSAGESRNVLIDANPLEANLRSDMLPWLLPPLPTETVQVGGKVGISFAGLDGLVEGAFLGPRKTLGVLLAWDLPGGRANAPSDSEFQRILMDPRSSALLWQRVKSRFMYKGRSVEADVESTAVSPDEAAALEAELAAEPELGILE